MPKNPHKPLKENKLFEITASDFMNNLEEYTRMMTNNIDFNTFDIISITRTDSDNVYTQQYACRKVNTQAYRIASDTKNIIQLPVLRKQKLN